MKVRHPRAVRTLPSIVGLAALAGCAAPSPTPGFEPSGAEVRAVRIDRPLVVDGTAEPAWDAAPEVPVPLEGVGGPHTCLVRAAVVKKRSRPGMPPASASWRPMPPASMVAAWSRSSAMGCSSGSRTSRLLCVA